MMKPFLVKAKISKTYYMDEKSSFIDDIRIVMSVDETLAYQKYNEFWKAKTQEYSVYYSVEECEVTEPIE